MDEYNQGWDPLIKKYFRKIVYSFVMFFSWLLIFATAGLYYDLGIIHGQVTWYNIVFYVLLLSSFVFMLWYLYKFWKDFL